MSLQSASKSHCSTSALQTADLGLFLPRVQQHLAGSVKPLHLGQGENRALVAMNPGLAQSQVNPTLLFDLNLLLIVWKIASGY